jgi:hypothetical protein
MGLGNWPSMIVTDCSFGREAEVEFATLAKLGGLLDFVSCSVGAFIFSDVSSSLAWVSLWIFSLAESVQTSSSTAACVVKLGPADSSRVLEAEGKLGDGCSLDICGNNGLLRAEGKLGDGCSFHVWSTNDVLKWAKRLI